MQGETYGGAGERGSAKGSQLRVKKADRSGLGGKCGEVSIRVAEAQRTHAEGSEPSGV